MSVGNRTWRVDYYPLGSTTGTELLNVIDVRITISGNAKSNTAEVVLTTIRGQGIIDGNVIYNPDDTFKVYAAEGEVNTGNADHLIGVFTIQDVEVQTESRTLKVTLMDKTYDMLSKIYVGDLNDTVPNIIANVYQTITNNRSALTNIASTKSDSSAFSAVEYFVVNKTAFEVINELSQPNYTGDDRTYIFWVDETEKLHWVYPGQTVEAQEFVYGTEPVINMKLTRAESSIVSMVIYNAGPDLNGNDYIDFYLAPNANTIKGQMRYEEMKYLSKDLQETAFWGTATNTQVQTVLKARADDNCRRIVNEIGTGLWNADISLKGVKLSFGDLYNVSATEKGFPKTKLRLNRIVHTMNKNGWETLLNLTQDAESLQ